LGEMFSLKWFYLGCCIMEFKTKALLPWTVPFYELMRFLENSEVDSL